MLYCIVRVIITFKFLLCGKKIQIHRDIYTYIHVSVSGPIVPITAYYEKCMLLLTVPNICVSCHECFYLLSQIILTIFTTP